jgi:hypothetical protein
MLRIDQWNRAAKKLGRDPLGFDLSFKTPQAPRLQGYSLTTGALCDSLILVTFSINAYAEKSRCWSAEKEPRYKEWIEWATRQADRIDPFISEKPESVSDRKLELSSW